MLASAKMAHTKTNIHMAQWPDEMFIGFKIQRPLFKSIYVNDSH